MLGVTAALACVAAAIGSAASSTLETGPSAFEVPGSESVEVRTALREATGVDPRSNVIALVNVPRGVAAPTSRTRVERVAEQLGRERAIKEVVTFYGSRDRALVSRDGRLTYVVGGFGPDSSEREARAAAVRIEDRFEDVQGVRLGGHAVVDAQFQRAVDDDLKRAELIAFPLLFLVLCWVFRGLLAALIPVAIGALAIVGSLAVLRIVGETTQISAFALNLVTGLGLGLAIDYSLLIVTRYRDELRAGRPPAAAMRVTLATAGSTVLYTSLTVTGALAVLLLFPQPFLYSMGIGGMLVATIAGVGALVVLPAILLCAGGWLERFALPGRRDDDRAEARWGALASWVMRRPVPVATIALVALIALASAGLDARFTFGDAHALPAGQSGRAVNRILEERFPPGTEAPILVELSAAQGRTLTPAALRRWAATARATPGVREVQGPSPGSAGTAFASVTSRAGPKDPETLELVRRLRRSEMPGLQVAVGGEAASLVDLQRGIVDHVALAAALAALWILLLVARLARSAVLALQTLVMAALSLAASFGALVLVFQDGRLESLLGFESEGALGSAEPIVLLFLVLALTSDYATFLLARIREAHDAGEPNPVAVGLARTGRVVTAAAVLFAIAIGALMTSDNVYVKQLGFGAAFAVLLDATLVRALLLPALVSLAGRWAWWMPRLRRSPHADVLDADLPATQEALR